MFSLVVSGPDDPLFLNFVIRGVFSYPIPLSTLVMQSLGDDRHTCKKLQLAILGASKFKSNSTEPKYRQYTCKGCVFYLSQQSMESVSLAVGIYPLITKFVRSVAVKLYRSYTSTYFNLAEY